MQLEQAELNKGIVEFETTAGLHTVTVEEVKDYCEADGLNSKDHSGSEIPAIDIDQYFEDNFDKCAEYYFYNVIQK